MISHFFTRPRAEARLLQQPSTTTPSAHLCKLCLLLCNREFHRNFLLHKTPVRNSPDRGFALYFSVKISTAF